MKLRVDTCLGIAVALGFMFGGYLEKQQLEADVLLYCDMVHLHQQDKELGWPDYKGAYNDQCTPDGKPKDLPPGAPGNAPGAAQPPTR